MDITSMMTSEGRLVRCNGRWRLEDKLDIASMHVAIDRAGPVYLAPPRQPGAVVPAGYTDRFRASGTVAHVIDEYRRGESYGDRYYACTGKTYPRRYILTLRLHPELVRQISQQLGYVYGPLQRQVSDLLAKAGVDS